MADTFASFAAKLVRFEKELGDEAQLHAIGKMAKAEAKSAASADLGGDAKFSGWEPTLDTAYDIVGPGKLLFKPTRRGAGPWTVAEQGRNNANASGFQGPGINVKTGVTSFTNAGSVRKVRSRKGKRWNGTTQGKGTASDALTRIDRKVPIIVNQNIGRAIRKIF